LQIIGVELQADDPGSMARRWSEVIGHPSVEHGDGAHAIPLDGGEIRFVPDRDGRGEGVSGIDLSVRRPGAILEQARARGLETQADEFFACGTRIKLQEPAG
jgi:hypothetical protein